MTIYELQNILSQYGLYVLAGLVFIEYLSFPGFPRGVVLPLMGILSRMGIFSFEYGLIAAAAASVAACLIIYFIGYAFPRPCMKFYSRRKKGAERFQAMEKFMKRYGRMALLRSRIYSVFRTFVSIPAGILRMNFWGYLISTLIGNGLHIFAAMGIANLVTMLII